MGYRSDVALAIKKEFVTPYFYKLVDHYDRFFVKEDVVIFEWDHIKWYDDRIERYLRDLRPEGYEIFIVGEEFQDVVTHGYLNMFDLERKITINENGFKEAKPSDILSDVVNRVEVENLIKETMEKKG